MSAAPAVEAIDLVKRFGDNVAVNGVSFQIPTGTIFGLLGPNGAGKTTIVRMLTTLSRPTSGTGTVAGYDIRTHPEQVRRHMGLTGQAATVDELLTGRENIRLIGRLYGLPRNYIDELAAELLTQFSLTDAADRPAKTYSGGMRRRLDLAVSLVARPPVLFLDEPTTGLDIDARSTMWKTIRTLVREGCALVLTTHYLEEAEALADRVTVLARGRIVAQGSVQQIRARVAQRRIRCVSGLAEGAIARWPQVRSVARDGERLEIITDQVESVTRLLLSEDAALTDLEIQRAGLAEAFVEITREAA